MGSKEPIPKEILFINGYNIRGLIYQFFLVLTQAETKILQLYKNFKNFCEKRETPGGIWALQKPLWTEASFLLCQTC